MAKKFVQVTGLNKALNYDATSGWTLKTDASVTANADENSILYITATANDTDAFGQRYTAGTLWVWAKGKLFDGNDTSTTYFTNVTGIDGNIDAVDNIETIVRKLIKKVGDAAASGVQSLTTSDDAWVTVDPDLNASTGAVTLTLTHGVAGTAVNTQGGESTQATGWGETAKVTIPKVGIDAKGHVSTLDTGEFSVVTLPAKPVTTLTTSGDTEVTATTNNQATGDVTVNVAHATHDAVKAGETEDKTLSSDTSSFSVLEVSTNGTGHVITATAHTITLPATAFSDTTYTFTGGTQEFTVTPVGGSAQTVNVTHMSKGTGSATAADGTYVSVINVDTYGHVIASANKTNGVYSDDSTYHAAGELAVWDGTTNKLKTSDKTILDRDISATSDTSMTTIPTVAQVVKYVLDNKVAGAMTYKGTKKTYNDIVDLTDMTTGDVWVLSADDEKAKYQQGDTFIYNGTAWDRIPAGDTTVENKEAILQFGGGLTEVAVVDGKSITVGVQAETALSVTTETSNETSGITYVSSVVKGTNSHDLTVKKADIRTATTTQTGIVQLENSSISSSTTTAVTPKALNDVNELAKTKSTVSYTQTVGQSSTGAKEIGKITINGTATTIYGIDTVYTHPTAPTDGTDKTATAGAASAKIVLTGVSIDTSGHVASLTSSDITSAYNQRAVNVNGKQLIATSATTTLDIVPGDNVTLTPDATTAGKVTIAATNTDEKVKATTSTAKSYLLGQTATGTAATATYNEAVYATNGALHATSLYEGEVSIHDSNALDWGTIS